MTVTRHRARARARLLASVALAAAIGFGVTGCAGSGSDGSSTTKPDLGAGTVLASTTTTATPTTAAVATTAATPTGLPDQEATAKKLYDAWFANDKVTASTVADPAAVDAFWKAAKGDYYLYNHCSTGEFDTSGCLFRGNNGTIQVDLEKRGANWIASGAFYSPPGSD